MSSAVQIVAPAVTTRKWIEWSVSRSVTGIAELSP